MKYKNYSAAVQYSVQDEVFHGIILGINDVVSFEGTTVEELKTAFQEAVDDYLETCEALGKPPERAYKGSFNVRVPAALHRAAANYATSRNITLNDFVKQALDFVVRKKPDLGSPSLD